MTNNNLHYYAEMCVSKNLNQIKSSFLLGFFFFFFCMYVINGSSADDSKLSYVISNEIWD